MCQRDGDQFSTKVGKQTSCPTTDPDVALRRAENGISLGRMVEAEELITHVSYLTSSDSKFLTGQNILVDGGRSVW